MRYLHVSANVRYWEDATVNDKKDVNGTLIPFRNGDLWEPIIDLDAGTIVNWPKGVCADIYYKVCDAGKYWLSDCMNERQLAWHDDYVPNEFLCYGDSGYGDYIIMYVAEDGKIDDYQKPIIKLGQWEKEAV